MDYKLWSLYGAPVVATGGNPWQTSQAEKWPKQAKTVAVGCHRLRFGAHGKEGVDGSSPSEGFTERPAKRPLELSHCETVVTRGHSRALAGVPSLGASAGGTRLVQADPDRPDPLCEREALDEVALTSPTPSTGAPASSRPSSTTFGASGRAPGRNRSPLEHAREGRWVRALPHAPHP